MREILFRAKRKNWRELPKEEWWVEGLPQKMWGDWHIINPDDENTAYHIDPETLCQYIVLKDKNGNRVWENDICEMVYDGQVHVYVIVWDAEELDFKGTNGKKNYGRNFEYLGCCEEIVRIGNIFDNPELLGQDGEES